MEEHTSVLRKLGLRAQEIRLPRQLDGLDGLVLPGGESTTLMSLIVRWGFREPLLSMSKSGCPILGTCAGAVLLSLKVSEREHEIEQMSLGFTDVEAVRNSFGRQARSFQEDLAVTGLEVPYPGVFIRAPLLLPLSDRVTVLSSVEEGSVMVRQDNLWLTAFHPELTEDDRIHRLFLRESGIAPSL